MAIERFREENYFLSSMYPVEEGIPILPGIIAPTVENPYQASKLIHQGARHYILFECETGFVAKKMARNILKTHPDSLRSDWEERKIEVMRACVALKFGRVERLAGLLADTGNQELKEGNPWKDTFWGVSPIGTDNGTNWLGRILMDTRAVLQTGHKLEPHRLLAPIGDHRAPQDVMKEFLLPLPPRQ